MGCAPPGTYSRFWKQSRGTGETIGLMQSKSVKALQKCGLFRGRKCFFHWVGNASFVERCPACPQVLCLRASSCKSLAVHICQPHVVHA
jgi:hypothetical protein